jgi:alkyl hydroperoxide reductase subunit AhpC
MIGFGEFEEITTSYKAFFNRLEKLEELGVDLFDGPISQATDTLFDYWTRQVANDEGQDLIYWWMFDDVEKKIYDDNGNMTDDIEDVMDFYNYLKREKLLYD